MSLIDWNATQLVKVIPELWAKRVREKFDAMLVAAKLFEDYSGEITEGNKLNIPHVEDMTANDKTSGSDVTGQETTVDETELSIDTWKEASFMIEDDVAGQVLKSYNIQRRYAERAAVALANAFDSDLLGLYTGLSQAVGASDADVSDANIVDAIQKLDVNDVPYEDRAFIFYPSVFWQDLLQAVAKYYDASIRGAGAPIATGVLPRLYGIPVYTTTQIPITATTWVHNLLVHKQAFAYAKQHDIRLQTNYIPEQLGTLTTADIIYGMVELNDDAAIVINSQK